MGVLIKEGENYPAKDWRSGHGSKGPWAFFRVKATKGYDQITVWAANPEQIVNPASVKIVEIKAVDLKGRKDERTGKWYPDYSITAVLEKTDDIRFGEGDINKTEEDFVNSLFFGG